MTSIAIDGPSAAGKSTVARRLAGDLGFIYVDTGALYRAIGLYAARNGADPADAAQVERLLPEITLDITHRADGQHILLCGEDVTDAIRTPEMSMAASAVSAHPAVRGMLLEQQRAFARKGDVVMDGRDIGTVVLPQAGLKIYLTASAEERAARRLRDHEARGESVDYVELLEDIRRRDHKDMTRAVAPLRKAEDAVLLDSTNLSFEQVVEHIKGLIMGDGNTDVVDSKLL